MPLETALKILSFYASLGRRVRASCIPDSGLQGCAGTLRAHERTKNLKVVCCHMILRILLVLALSCSSVPQVRGAGAPFNIVYGWFPNWISSSATSGLDASQLTHLAWFSCDVDTTTGALTGLSQWQSTPVVTWAQNNGIRVHLTVTSFGAPENRALLNAPTRRTRCIREIVSAIRLRNADGVNLDFEAVGGSERANLVLFVQELRDSLPSKEITMATPPVDWTNAFDLAALSRVCDFLLLMGYDYYWSGSSTAGPVAPLGGENYTVARSVTTYLAAGVDPLRLVLAVRYANRAQAVPHRGKATIVSKCPIPYASQLLLLNKAILANQRGTVIPPCLIELSALCCVKP